MERKVFSELLLLTAFSCMACDGEIDRREVLLIKELDKGNSYFSYENIEAKINELISEINKKGKVFISEYFQTIKNASLSEKEELAILEIAYKTIIADERTKYSEIKFFKIIRSKLKVSKKIILQNLPEIDEDYLEQDIIIDNYTERLKEEYFGMHILTDFDLINIEKPFN